jgi:23S rRNA-/tRNA-specific pseudouridylate synthase
MSNTTTNLSAVPEVALVWEDSTASCNDTTTLPCFKVALKPIECDDTVTLTICNDTKIPLETAIYKNEDGVSSENDDILPESVLLYERQLRKAQHAKKCGRLMRDEDLQVVHVDEYIVVVNKPAGVLTVPGVHANPSILDLVHKVYGQSIADPVSMIVHRLDMDTSGLVIFARTLDVSKQLHAMFRDRKIDKEYECLVMGHLHLPEWLDGSSSKINAVLVDLPLQRDHEHPPFMRVSTPKSEEAAMSCVDQLQQHGWKKIMKRRAKPSQSMLTIVEHGTKVADTSQQHLPYTRIRLEPITGRTHQLRVHWYVVVTNAITM